MDQRERVVAVREGDRAKSVFEPRADRYLHAGVKRDFRSLRQLAPRGPDGEAGARIAAGFARTRSGESQGFRAWLLGWLGTGPRPRAFGERLAAGVLTLATVGGGGTAAAGGDPVAIVRDVAQTGVSAVQNLDPRHNPGATTTTTPRTAPTPATGPSATATATPDDHGDDKKDDSKDKDKTKDSSDDDMSDDAKDAGGTS